MEQSAWNAGGAALRLLPEVLDRFFLGQRGGEDVVSDLEVSRHVFLEFFGVATPFDYVPSVLRAEEAEGAEHAGDRSPQR